MQRLRSAENRRERLNRDARNVVHGLLRGKRHSGGLRMEAQQPGALVLRAETVFHHAVPNLPGGTVLGDLFEEIVVRVEEKTQSGAELVNVKPATARPLYVFDAVVERERQFLQSRRSSFPNVISADGNGVEARRELRAELEGVDDQPHRRRRRIDIFLLCDVFLENVVLK